MKKLITICCMVLVFASAYSQAPTKFDFYLALRQAAMEKGTEDGSRMLDILIQGNIAGISQLVQKSGGVVKYHYGNIAAIRIPEKALPAFYMSTAVKRMEGAPPHIVPCNDTMRMHNHLVEAQMGQAPLTKPYKGKGVVIGMIDTGIDFTHPDFLDSTGKSRILSIWDMNKDSGKMTPLPYGYGKEFDKTDLDTALAHNISSVITYMDSSSGLEWGHGTHVSGVAAGNGRSNGTCIGAAPEADIMMVTYNFTTQTATEMTDAASFIYNKAESYGEPCVINASLGDYDGSHDGFDLQAQMIDSMVTAKPGRVFVAAAGNGSANKYHLGYTLIPGDTNFTWFAYYASNYDGIYFDVWADTANFRKVQYAIGVDAVEPYIARGLTSYDNVKAHLGSIVYDTIRNSAGNIIGTVQRYAQLVGSTYSLDVQINPDSTSYYWRFQTTGTGIIDAWYPDPTPMVDTGLPSAVNFPAIKNYKLPDTISTLCSSFQCSPNVITVGDYFNRKSLLDYDTVTYVLYGPNTHVGELTSYSGVGPTRDGRIKPEVASAGDICMSVLAAPLRAGYITYAPQNIDTGAWHDYDGGTSTASPGTAGACALYLEMYPNATNIEVKNALIYCSDQDSYTGTTPNNSYGYGKTDAFKMLTGCALGIPVIAAPPVTTLLAYPNPSKNSTTIEYDFSTITEYCTANIVVYDVLGKEVGNIELKNNKGSVSYNTANLVSNAYFYSLEVDGKKVHTEKLLVVK